jgi:mycofactocin precursor
VIDNTELLTAVEDDDATVANAVSTAAHDTLVEDELLVEDVSIDGMCGVY